MAAAGAGAVGKQWVPLQRQLVPITKDGAEAYRRNARRRQKEAIQNALSKGHLKTLDRELILESQSPRTADDGSTEETVQELENVLRVSLPSGRVYSIDDMALLSCPRLRLCNLPDCFVNDMAAFYGCVNLLKLDLSNNQIEHVPRGDFWSSLSSLRVLYLHGNNISDRSCLQYLNHCPRLHVLTLHSTPLSLSGNYRHHVINGIMSLQALDEYVVSDEEIIENMTIQGKFQTFSPHLKLQLYTPFSKETGFLCELRGVYHLLLTVDHTLAHYSPVLIVQRWTRGWLTRRALAKSTDSRIRSLLSRKRLPGKSTIAAPPPTANTTLRPVLQALSPQTNPVKSSRCTISTQVPLLSHPHPSHSTTTKSYSVPNCKSTMSVSLPPPPPSSPTLHSPRTHTGALIRGHISTSQQDSSLPLESCTLSVNPDSSRLQRSLFVNLNHLHQRIQSHTGTSSPEERTKSKELSGQTAVEKPALERETKKEEFESDTVSGMTVSGQKTEVMMDDNRFENLAQMKKEDGKQVREAEKQIVRCLEETRKLPTKALRIIDPPTTIHGSPRLTKEAMAFSRAFNSMTLSTLKAVDRIHEAGRVNDNWNRKVAHVSRMKMEREKRRHKIKEFRQRMRETIEAWKSMKENKIARMQEQNAKKVSQDLLDRSVRRKTDRMSRTRKGKEQYFASEFTRQVTSIGREIMKDDREMATEEKKAEIKEQVQQLSEAAKQRREEIQTDREIRDAQLMWEGALDKKELDGKIVQAAAERMAEAKRRVGRAKNRREAAKASVARARERYASQDTPAPHDTLPPLRLDLRNKSELADACSNALQKVTTGNRCPGPPYRLHCFTHKANHSWQRGTVVLAEHEKPQPPRAPPPLFPTIKETATPTHPMMKPRYIMRSLTSTPFQSELTEQSPDGSDIASLTHLYP